MILRSYYTNLNDSIMMTITNFETNVYDIAVVVIVLFSTTSATKEGKKALGCIYKAVNTSMDAKLNGRVSVAVFFAFH